jgi:hypothetical protein
MSESPNGWIGVDLDGTLARYDGWMGEHHIGEPIPLMQQRVKHWLAEGKDVRIFTARVSGWGALVRQEIEDAIEDWCEKHLGKTLPITCEKDFAMRELWDDLAIGVVPNTGEIKFGR